MSSIWQPLLYSVCLCEKALNQNIPFRMLRAPTDLRRETLRGVPAMNTPLDRVRFFLHPRVLRVGRSLLRVVAIRTFETVVEVTEARIPVAQVL